MKKLIGLLGGFLLGGVHLASAYVDNTEMAPENAPQTETSPFRAGYYRFRNKVDALDRKKMLGAVPGYVKWTNWDGVDNAYLVWQVIDRNDGSFLIRNVGINEYISGINGISEQLSAPLLTSRDSMGQGVFISEIEKNEFTIRHHTNKYYLHAESSSSNELGNSNRVVTWFSDADASRWYIEPISPDSIPYYEELAAQYKLDGAFSNLLKRAREKYRLGSAFEIAKDELLLQQKSQILSNAAQISNDAYTNSKGVWGSTLDGKGYEALVDNDASTFFHSAWEEGPVNKPHHLDIDLLTSQSNISIAYYKRIDNDKNFPKSFNIYAAQAYADTTVAENWKLIETFVNQPADQDTVLIAGIDLHAPYQYIRFEVTETKQSGMLLNGYPYFAISGMQIYPTSLKPTCFNASYPDVAQSMLAAIEKASAVLPGATTQNDIDQLQKALDTYMSYLGDPTEFIQAMDLARNTLKQAIAIDSKTDLNGLTIYPEPGTYPVASKQQFQQIFNACESYLNTGLELGIFDKDLLNTQLEKLQVGLEDFKKTRRTFKYADENSDGTWYQIAAANRYFYANPDANRAMMRQGVIYVKQPDSPLERSLIAFAPMDTLKEKGIDKAYAEWRFIALTDSTFAIQNRATHLFISNSGNNQAKLSASPIGYKITDLGFGSFLFKGYNLDGSETVYDNLHSEVSTGNVVYWSANTLGSGSTWDIINTEEVRESEEGEAVENWQTADVSFKEAQIGRYYTFCFPVAIDRIYDLQAPESQPAYRISHQTKEGIWLTPINGTIPAGEPFIYLPGNSTERYTDEPTAADTTTIHIRLASGNEIALEPKSVNGLEGNYYSSTWGWESNMCVLDSYYAKLQEKNIETIIIADSKSNDFNEAYLFKSEIPTTPTADATLCIPFQDYIILTEKIDSVRLLLKEILADADKYAPYIGLGAGKYDCPRFNNIYNWGKSVYAGIDVTLEDLESANKQLKDVISSLKLNEVPVGHFYRIRNCKTGTYILSNADTAPLKLQADANGNYIESTVFFLSNDGRLTGSLMLNLSGSSFDSKEFGNAFTLSPSGIDRTYYIEEENGNRLAANSNQLATVAAAENDTTAAWYLEEVTDPNKTPFHRARFITYGDKSYATVYAPVALSLPAGITAYTVTVADDRALLNPIEGNIIPAGTAVVLESSKAGIHFLDYAAGTDKQADSDLEGVLMDTPVAGRYLYYTLQTINGQLGFFQYGGNTLNAYKAYLRLSPDQQIRGFIIQDGTTTGIGDTLEVEDENAVIYDVSGRRIHKISQPGIYIINGEKVIKK